MQRAELGVTTASEVEGTLQDIQGAVSEVSGVAKSVADAVSEQTTRIEQINQALQQIDSATQSNAANAEETASASEELSSQAVSLIEVVDSLRAIIQGGNGQRGTPAALAALDAGNGRERYRAPEPQMSGPTAPTRNSAGMEAATPSLRERIAMESDDEAPAYDDRDFRDMA